MEMTERNKDYVGVEKDGFDFSGLGVNGSGEGFDEGGTIRRNAAAHLNQIGAEIQLTASVRFGNRIHGI